MIDKFNTVKNDFIGASLNINRIVSFFEIVIFVLLIFVILYLFGKKIRLNIFHIIIKSKFIECFINIAIGYIFFATGICILGIFSLLTPVVLSSYLLFIFLFCVYKINFVTEFLLISRNIKNSLTEYIEKDYKVAIVVGILIFITFLRLIPPETGADALDYHTSYPRLYLKNHTMMLDPIATEGVIAIPQLGEMLYIVPEFFDFRDASRFIHFTFYLLTVALICYIGFLYNKSKYAPIIFASSPLVLHIAPSAYGDFPATFLFLLSVILVLEKNLRSQNIFLSGILLGGMFASKMWSLVFLPIFVIYILNKVWKENKQYKLRIFLLFLLISISIPSVWYLRSIALTGNPFYYHIDVVPQVLNLEKFLPNDIYSTTFNFSSKIRTDLFFDFSPLIILCLIPIIYKPIEFIKEVRSSPLWIFTLITVAIYSFVPQGLYDSRYLLPLYSILVFPLSIGLNVFKLTFNLFKYILYLAIILLLGYYSTNSFIGLLYGFGWANTENYLTRYHTSINGDVSYYDFYGKFSKLINKNETVATYGISMYYYADFEYKHVFYFFKNQRMLKQLKESNISKLLIRGGDINWFCQKLQVLDCNKEKYVELASYTPAKQYLYEIK